MPKMYAPNCRQCQHGRDAQTDAIAGRLAMNPKRHPRQNDNQNARHINLNIYHYTDEQECRNNYGANTFWLNSHCIALVLFSPLQPPLRCVLYN